MLCADHQDVHHQKEAACESLDSARDGIASWHAKSSSSFFGNGGKKIPKHSLFGQSFGDLNGLKADRANAAEEIADCKKRLQELSAAIESANARIAEVKADRQAKVDLLQQGVHTHILRVGIQSGQRERLAHMVADREEFLNAAWHRTGSAALQEQIERIATARLEFLAGFDTKAESAARKLAHRTDWLRRHDGTQRAA